MRPFSVIFKHRDMSFCHRFCLWIQNERRRSIVMDGNDAAEAFTQSRKESPFHFLLFCVVSIVERVEVITLQMIQFRISCYL